MTEQLPETASINVRLRVQEFGIPPIHDGLVFGKKAPIGCAAFQKALALLQVTPFEHFALEDDVVSDILIRSHILRRVPPERLKALVVRRVKPLMSEDEVIHLDIEAEVFLEDQA